MKNLFDYVTCFFLSISSYTGIMIFFPDQALLGFTRDYVFAK